MASSEFNRMMHQILSGLKKIKAYFDDIIMHGAIREECMQNLYAYQRFQLDFYINKKNAYSL